MKTHEKMRCVKIVEKIYIIPIYNMRILQNAELCLSVHRQQARLNEKTWHTVNAANTEKEIPMSPFSGRRDENEMNGTGTGVHKAQSVCDQGCYHILIITVKILSIGSKV